MGSEYNKATKCVRWAFVIFNVVFMVFGAIAFSIGVWGAVVGSTYEVITGSDAVSAAALLVVGGVITMVIAAVGIIGACGMWRPLLVIYAIFVVIVIIFEFVAAVLAFIFVENITERIDDNMRDAIRDYEFDGSSDTNTAVENVQDLFDCCGADNATDWVSLNPDAVRANNNVPPADCTCSLDEDGCILFENVMIGNGSLISFNAWEDGCVSLLEENLEPVGIAIGVIAIIFAAIESVLAMMALCLCCCIYSARRQAVV